MAKRMLDCNASDFAAFTKEDFLSSVAKSEGRVLVCETIGTLMPMLGNVTNAEFVAAMGADVLLLNVFDVQNPVIAALPHVPPQESVRELKRLTGRCVGINLEPVAPGAHTETDPMWAMSDGRRATVENAQRAADMGVNLVVLTGNPGNGVTNAAITETLTQLHAALGHQLVLAAGKMHASGILAEAADQIMTKQDITAFVQAGADIILLPAPGTVPGITTELVRSLVQHAHALGALTLTAIGTSQEGADTDTLRRIALECKMTGTDMHHLGDAGYGGMALPENILAYSIAMRGVRHTYHRMAASVQR